MINRINCFLDKKFKDPEHRLDFQIFLFPLTVTIFWCIYMFTEAFQLNFPGHTISFEVTFAWLTIITGYAGRKFVARRNLPDLSGQSWGRTLGALTIIFGFSLHLAYLFRDDMIIPDQLFIGINGVLVNVFGWEIIKAYHRPTKNDQG